MRTALWAGMLKAGGFTMAASQADGASQAAEATAGRWKPRGAPPKASAETTYSMVCRGVGGWRSCPSLFGARAHVALPVTRHRYTPPLRTPSHPPLHPPLRPPLHATATPTVTLTVTSTVTPTVTPTVTRHRYAHRHAHRYIHRYAHRYTLLLRYTRRYRVTRRYAHRYADGRPE